MKTGKILLPALLALTLAGCGDEPASTAPAQTDPAAESAPAATAATTAGTSAKGRKLRVPLPENVVLRFPYHFRSDKVDAAGDTPQRRVTVEFLGGDVAAASANLTNSMRRADFKLIREAALEGGRQRLIYSKKGFGRVHVTVAPSNGKLRNPEAAGTILMLWPVTAAPAG